MEEWRDIPGFDGKYKASNQMQDSRRVTIPDSVVDAIVEELTSAMKEKIKAISPTDDPSVEYGAHWSTGFDDDEDYLELAEPFDEYEVTYRYELSWRYRAWTEYWTDLDCTRDFDELEDQEGTVFDISICTPDGDEVQDSICERIANTVNEKIK